MADLFWLSDAQWAVMAPFMPKYRPGARRVDDRRAISGIVHVIKSGCRWRDCPPAYGPHTTVYKRFNRWSHRGFWQKLQGAPMRISLPQRLYQACFAPSRLGSPGASSSRFRTSSARRGKRHSYATPDDYPHASFRRFGSMPDGSSAEHVCLSPEAGRRLLDAGQILPFPDAVTRTGIRPEHVSAVDLCTSDGSYIYEVQLNLLAGKSHEAISAEPESRPGDEPLGSGRGERAESD